MVTATTSKISLTPTPVDHGYAWVVLASCMVLRLLADGFWCCLGILMLQWETRFNVNASQTGWIGSSFMFILLSAAPVASALSNRLTYRLVVVGAGILIFICIFSLSLVTQFWQIYFIMPILGFGVGIVYQTSVIYFVYYFDKRYAFANGLVSCAGGVGVFVLPPLWETLNTYFGTNGALYLISAIMANVCVMGALLRPSKYEQMRTMPKTRELAIVPADTDLPNEGDLDLEKRKCNFCYGFLHEIADNFDVTLFRRMVFIFQAIINGVLYGGIYCSLIFIAPYAISVGMSELKASFVTSAVGASVCLIRLSPLVGYLVDKKIISKSMLTGSFFVLNGGATITLAFMTSYGSLLAVSIVYGLSVGVGGAVIMVICTNAAGSRDKAPGASAWMLLLCGVGSLVGILLTGFLREATGSLRPPMIICGVLTICMGLNCLAFPLQKRWQQSIDNRKSQSVSTRYVYSSLTDLSKSSQV